MTMSPHRSRLRGLTLGVLLSLLLAPARGEDIDIYGEPNNNTDRPNVLLVLDSSANWSSSIPAADCYYKDNGVTTTAKPADQGKKIAIEMCALNNLVDGLPVDSSRGADQD